MRRIAFLTFLIMVALPATATAGGGGGCGQTLTEGETLTVSMTQSCFGPEVMEVVAGDTVTFVNDDPYAHTVTAAGQSWGSTSLITHANSVDVTFDSPGIYPYMCILHPGMAGAVVVTEKDSSALSGAGAVVNDPIRTASSDASDTALPGLVYAGAAAAIVVVASVRVVKSRSLA